MDLSRLRDIIVVFNAKCADSACHRQMSRRWTLRYPVRTRTFKRCTPASILEFIRRAWYHFGLKIQWRSDFVIWNSRAISNDFAEKANLLRVRFLKFLKFLRGIKMASVSTRDLVSRLFGSVARAFPSNLASTCSPWRSRDATGSTRASAWTPPLHPLLDIADHAPRDHVLSTYARTRAFMPT